MAGNCELLAPNANGHTQEGDPGHLPAGGAGGVPEETEFFRAARQWRIERLAALDGMIARRKAFRDGLRSEIAACDALLGEDANSGSVPNRQGGGVVENEGDGRNGTRRNRRRAETSRSVDAVVDILGREGALHYRDIYDKLVAQGVTIIGLDPAATLLARIWRDSRICRVRSGVYAIRE